MFKIEKPNSNAIVCVFYSSSNKEIRTNLNGHEKTDYLDSDNKKLGLSDYSLSTSDGKLYCTFTRKNKDDNTKYYSLTSSNPPYILAAHGLVEDDCKCENIYINLLRKPFNKISNWLKNPFEEPLINIIHSQPPN